MMTQDEIDLAWSREIAESVIDELAIGKVISDVDFRRAVDIAAQQIHVHLISGIGRIIQTAGTESPANHLS